MDTVDTIKHASGLIARIEYDQDCPQPYEDDDGTRIVILARHYSDPARGACGSTPEDVAEWVKENESDWYIFPLFMFEHSGVALSIADFGDRWDSGQVGIIALKRSEWYDTKTAEDSIRKSAALVAEEFGRWMNGECFGYVIEDEDGGHVDSCWGFIGMDYAMERAQEELEREAEAYQPRTKLADIGEAIAAYRSPDDVGLPIPEQLRLIADRMEEDAPSISMEETGYDENAGFMGGQSADELAHSQAEAMKLKR